MKELIYHELNVKSESIDETEIMLEYWIESEEELADYSRCGIDQRQKVVGTNMLPYNAICKLYTKGKNGKTYVGSGWLVSGTKLYTAGHCVFSKKSGGWKEKIIVIPGKSGLLEPYGRFEAVSVCATKGWIDNGSARYDMGAIKLNAPVPLDEFLKPVIDDSDDGEVCGYPADRDRGMFQYKMRESLTKKGGRFYYEIDTYGGQSGCPLLKNRSEGIGIHNYGGCPNKSSDLYEEFIQEVANW
ncbi:trypsin-like serine peptidase [Flagellimonas myxillae]|uniref:trypsin-like serine peptidase n=1 Tax=Flagellimonas myxillae TaxID=2942214 RepID=UPI00201F48BE|nr:trypsin-like serine protease [Muricauda myxillae]MCL6265959.1 trypsin-like serine protease [Muricauda myxillae]